jgi:Rieske Fe-S protein
VDSDDTPPTRRRIMQLAAGALGGGVGAAVLIPASRLVAHPTGRDTVTAADAPLDAIALDRLGAAPLAVPLVAPLVRDGWATTADVTLGVAWLRRRPDGSVSALSGVCPHKGCAIGYAAAAGRFECPCHDARFDLDGRRLHGPAERDLDPLEATVEGSRVLVRWVRYRPGGADRTPA